MKEKIQDYNRKVLEIRGLIDFIAKTSASIETFVNNKAKFLKNEVTDLIDAVVKRHGRLQLPIMKGKYLRKVSHRERLQDADNMKAFAEERGFTTFDELQDFLDERGAVYDKLESDLDKKTDRANELQAKLNAWERYELYLKVAKESKSLKGFAKLKFDKEHRETLDLMPREIEILQRTIKKDEPITPKAWKKEMYQLISEQLDVEDKMSEEVHDLAYAEVLKFNKTNEEREHNNEISAREHQHSRKRSYYER